MKQDSHLLVAVALLVMSAGVLACLAGLAQMAH
jgi:hypothetical protein